MSAERRTNRESPAEPSPDLAIIRDACKGDNPYIATTLLSQDDSAPVSLIAVRDTELDEIPKGGVFPHRFELAAVQETGPVHGLAYDHVREQLYSARIHFNRSSFGHPNVGSVYLTDMSSGQTRLAIELQAGLDPRPNLRWGQDFSVEFIHSIGRIGLGDIEVDEKARWLFVMNLQDKMVHRYELPELNELPPMSIASNVIDGFDEVLPFGIGIWDELLYCGAVVLDRNAPRIALFRGDVNGKVLELLTIQGLDYLRQAEWRTWSDVEVRPSPSGSQLFAEPIVADIEFSSSGVPIIGLANRRLWIQDYAEGGGNVLPTVMQSAMGLIVLPDPEYYADQLDPFNRGVRKDILNGALARLPYQNVVVASTWPSPGFGSLRWLNNDDGAIVGSVNGVEGVYSDNAGMGDIEVLCAPKHMLPTETPTLTSGPTLSPTATWTATNTATVVETAIPTPRPIYLPLAQTAHCVPSLQPMDVTLVLDLSTSMLRPSEGSGRKVDGLLRAVEAFIDVMLGDGVGGGVGGSGKPRVGLVGFNHEAFTVASLSSDRAAVQSVIETLPSRLAEGTRLDLALRAGAEQLSREGRAESRRVLVLITDGLPNQVPTAAPTGSQEDTVLRAAAAARATGILLYAVGLGRPDAPDPLDRINAGLLAAIAGASDRYHQTPDAGELAAIYREIAGGLLGCPNAKPSP